MLVCLLLGTRRLGAARAVDAPAVEPRAVLGMSALSKEAPKELPERAVEAAERIVDAADRIVEAADRAVDAPGRAVAGRAERAVAGRAVIEAWTERSTRRGPEDLALRLRAAARFCLATKESEVLLKRPGVGGRQSLETLNRSWRTS